MGSNMVSRLLEKNFEVVAYDVNRRAVKQAEDHGAHGAESISHLMEQLETPRFVWIMVPRDVVENVLEELTPHLSKNDTIVDGGNSYYEDTMHRAENMEIAGINYLDVGVSGGVEGARNGACLMIGGPRECFGEYESLFASLSAPLGYGYVGLSGAGHYVKMVHNAIEYGMMASIAEGLAVINEAKDGFRTDLKEVIKVYAHGSIIESRLIDWLMEAWKKDPGLRQLPGEVPFGETEEEMEKIIKHMNMPVLAAADTFRHSTRGAPSFRGQIINALREEFGGHDPNKGKDI